LTIQTTLGTSIVKKNVAANFLGSGWTALLAVLLIPLYIKFLGVEAWGIIGIFITLQSLSSLLDLGLSSTLNREMARLSLRSENGQEMGDLVRTLEVVYWGIALVAGISVFGLASPIANYWVQASELSPNTIQNAIRLMGLGLFFQCASALYFGGLMGLQRQVLGSGINASIATVRGAGSVLILWKLSFSLEAFFVWHVVAGLLQTLTMRWFLWRSLPKIPTAPRFQRELLRRSWRFAAGMSAVTILSLILTQVDKVVLSRVLSLEMFGYYVLASSVATSLCLLAAPVGVALYPRFIQLASLGDLQGLKEIYHHSCQLMSTLIIPIAVIIVLFSKEILTLWTGNATTISHTHLLLSILIVGAAVNGLLYLPFALQLAYGWTKLIFQIFLVSVLTLTPLIILIASFYGATGAAVTLVIFNLGVALVAIQFMHGRILRGEKWRWYVGDVGLPLSVALGAALLCRVLVPTDVRGFQLFISLVSTSLVVIGSTVLATPVTRAALITFFRAWQGRVLKTS
jgi:O-antigen/teichoic acid export membrane protein